VTARGFIRGHAVEWDGSVWRWSDTNMPVDHERPCPACGQIAEPGGPDPCLGWLEGVISACCGHGVEPPYHVDLSGRLVVTDPTGTPETGGPHHNPKD